MELIDVMSISFVAEIAEESLERQRYCLLVAMQSRTNLLLRI